MMSSGTKGEAERGSGSGSDAVRDKGSGSGSDLLGQQEELKLIHNVDVYKCTCKSSKHVLKDFHKGIQKFISNHCAHHENCVFGESRY